MHLCFELLTCVLLNVHVCQVLLRKHTGPSAAASGAVSGGCGSAQLKAASGDGIKGKIHHVIIAATRDGIKGKIHQGTPTSGAAPTPTPTPQEQHRTKDCAKAMPSHAAITDRTIQSPKRKLKQAADGDVWAMDPDSRAHERMPAPNSKPLTAEFAVPGTLKTVAMNSSGCAAKTCNAPSSAKTCNAPSSAPSIAPSSAPKASNPPSHPPCNAPKTCNPPNHAPNPSAAPNKACTPSRRPEGRQGHAPSDASDRNQVIVIEEPELQDGTQDGTQDATPCTQGSSQEGSVEAGRGQRDSRCTDTAKEDVAKDEQAKGMAPTSAGKKAKTGLTPGCCWKCGATKSHDWLAFYVDGGAQTICKGCQVYHKDNKIVVNALVPDEADLQDSGDRDFGHPSNHRTRAQQRLPETGQADVDVSMDGSQIYGCSAQMGMMVHTMTSPLMPGKCKRCTASESTAWYDDDKHGHLCICATCHHKRTRLSWASPRKRWRAEGEGVTFSEDDCYSTSGKLRAAGSRCPRPKLRRLARPHVHAAAGSAQAHSSDHDNDAEEEVFYRVLVCATVCTWWCVVAYVLMWSHQRCGCSSVTCTPRTHTSVHC